MTAQPTQPTTPADDFSRVPALVPPKDESGAPLPDAVPEPLFKAVGDMYVFKWPSMNAQVECSHFEEKSGELRCEIAAFAKSPMANGLLDVARMNCASTRGRNEVIAAFKKVCPDPEIDWDLIVRYAAVWSTEAYRNGEPEVDLWSVVPRPTRMLVRPFAVDDGVSSVFSAGGEGKSTGALAMALTAGSAREVIGEPTTGDLLPTGYFDYEDSADIHAERGRAMLRGHGIDYLPIVFWRRMSVRFREALPGVKRMIGERGIQLGVLDSMNLARGSDVSDADATIRTYLAMRETGIAWIVVDHVNRADSERGEAKMAMGSVTGHNSARLTHYFERIGSEGGDEVVFAFYNRKANRTKIARQTTYRAVYQNDGDRLVSLRFERLRPESVPAVLDRMPLTQRVMYEFTDKSEAGVELLSESLNVAPDKINQALRDLQREGKVVPIQSHPGFWGRADTYRQGPDD